MFNLKQAVVEDKKFIRTGAQKPRGQNFKLKFRVGKTAVKQGKEEKFKAKEEFTFSNALLQSLDIENHSLAMLGSGGDVGIVVTPEGHKKATMFVKREGFNKTSSFSHYYLQRELVEAGLISVPETDEKGYLVDVEDELVGKNQFLDLEYVADISDVPTKTTPAEEVDSGDGMPVYQIIEGKEIVNNSESEELVEETEEIED